MRLARYSFHSAFRSGALTLLLSTALPGLAAAQADLFIRDTPSDTGVEPYSGPGPVYLSPDIWNRITHDTNYEPDPFPTGAQPWSAGPHENPEYRDPKTSRPNFIYVRVHNRGSSASTGTERLRVYQAKASTGLAWPSSWVDNVDTACGQSLLHGIEITKPRLNAKDVSAADRTAYRDAVIAIASDPAYRYNDSVQYFAKQNTVHTSGPEHRNPAFPPWHREMVNRYENLLREVNPTLKLLYWDFREEPTTGVSLFTDSFMGPASGAVTGTLGSALPVPISRGVGNNGCTFDTDATITSSSFNDYDAMRRRIEIFPRNHDCAHGTIGGGSGDMSFQGRAARDPFFFLLHANVDRHWATWQRNGANPDRLDPVSAYGSASSDASINRNMRPWDGTFSVAPWTGAGAYAKTSKDPSVTFPPIYDTAPLNIPVLQPGESTVIEIPWYPPNVNSFNCAGQAGHFCLLARIETQTAAPFGMSTPEVMSVSSNTVNNNNIAWKNLTIVDNVAEPGLRFLTGTTIRNFFDREAFFAIRLVDRTAKRRFLLPEFADIGIALPDEILERVARDDRLMQDLKFGEIRGFDRKVLLLSGKEPVFRLPMKAGESFTAEFIVALRDDKPPRELLEEPFLLDIEQVLDLPRAMFDRRDSKALDIGGVRWELDFARALKAREDQPDGGRVFDFDLDRIGRLRDFRPVDLRLDLTVDRFRGFESIGTLQADTRHLSPGEPLEVSVVNDDPAESMLRLSLEVDGEERAVARGAELTEQLRFDEPGVHVITTTGLNADGELEQRRVRVLVSRDIPPVTAILSPQGGEVVKLGDTVTVTAEIAPAFERKTEEITLRVMEGDRFSQDMVPVDAPLRELNGRRLVELDFTPRVTGHHMVQVTARDDAGNLGVSGQVMFMVTD